eukprot:TRINITY_DN3576_c0_g1_i1.p1 TRINITY_DN3576_c0_g1~~TRINITY_DN3576_c0_g1_i1.p1  ORF type:complete len:356 (-),score=89.98 TRINITY_DN3576_c0_g1_i1:1308-2219(-)
MTSFDWVGAAERTTDIILFSLETTSDGTLTQLERIPAWVIRTARDACDEFGTKLWVSIGGAARSDGFAEATAKPEARRRLISNLVEYVRTNKLDGVDVNWEFPKTDAEYAGWNRLLSELKVALKTKLLSTAIPPGYDAYLAEESWKSLDLIHVMVYDNWCQTPKGSKPPCRHSTPNFAYDVVRYYRDLPSEKISKITIGIPFYGRHMDNNGVIGYYDVIRKNKLISIDSDEDNGFYFNGVSTVKDKTKLAMDFKLGGVMIWELGHDIDFTKPKSLLSSIHRAAYGDVEEEEVAPKDNLANVEL